MMACTPNYTRLWIPPGEPGTWATLHQMRMLARQVTTRIQQRALLLGNPESVNNYIRSRWVIVPDPPDAEFVMGPDLQLCQEQQNGYLYGDCDDSATLAAALLYTLGIPCWFVAIRLPGEIEFSHVWTRTLSVDSMFLDIDPIVSEAALPITQFAEKLELGV